MKQFFNSMKIKRKKKLRIHFTFILIEMFRYMLTYSSCIFQIDSFKYLSKYMSSGKLFQAIFPYTVKIRNLRLWLLMLKEHV
jgi:hypothetical protein